MSSDPPESLTGGEWTRRLEAERAVPGASFQSELRSQLLDHGHDARILISQHDPRIAVGAYAAGGLFLLAIVVVGVLGLGPLSAG